MKKMPARLLVIDIEATCWDQPKDQPAGEKNEIIEIGLVPFSLKTLVISEPKSILVKPSMSKVSAFCTKITTLTQEQVDAGISFREACKNLIDEMKTQEIPWVSWGDYDRKQFVWQCDHTKTPYPFGAGHWNFKDTFAKMMGLRKDVSLARALDIMNLDPIGTPHRGADDAFNIARVMTECFRRIRGNNEQEAANEGTGDETDDSDEEAGSEKETEE